MKDQYFEHRHFGDEPEIRERLRRDQNRTISTEFRNAQTPDLGSIKVQEFGSGTRIAQTSGLIRIIPY